MAVYKRAGSDIYYMDFTMFYRRFFRSTGKTDKEEARKVEEQERKRIWDETFSGGRPLSSFIRVKPSARRPQGRSAEYRLLACIGNKPLSLITNDDVDRLLRPLKRRRTAPATMNKYLRAGGRPICGS